MKKIITKIAILNGDLKVREGGPITIDGRVGKGVTLEIDKDVSPELAQSWVDAGKAVDPDAKAEKAEKPAPAPPPPPAQPKA